MIVIELWLLLFEACCLYTPPSAQLPSLRLADLVSQQRKPYSAITVQVDRLTSEQYEEDDVSGIVELIEVVRLQQAGPTEAARALRKKL